MSETPLNNDSDIKELVGFVTAVREALSDKMVERLTTTVGGGVEFLDRLNDEETREAFMSLISNITAMHKSGAMDTLFEIVSLLHAMKSAMTDNMLERLFTQVEKTADTITNEETLKLIENTRDSLKAASANSQNEKPSGGLWSTMNLLSKPRSRQSLSFLLAFSKELEKRTKDPQDGL